MAAAPVLVYTLGREICWRRELNEAKLPQSKKEEWKLIKYVDSLDGTRSANLNGFFVGWPNPPSPDKHLEILTKSDAIVLAIDKTTGQVVGFINAISDGVLSAYIPLLEVLPEYQKQGIGSELVRRMLSQLSGLYMVDLLCDKELQPYYERFGMKPISAMMIRNFDRQSG